MDGDEAERLRRINIVFVRKKQKVRKKETRSDKVMDGKRRKQKEERRGKNPQTCTQLKPKPSLPTRVRTPGQ